MFVSVSASKPVSHVPDSLFTGTCRVGTQASFGRALPATYMAEALQGSAAPNALSPGGAAQECSCLK